jgi:hypothetical protein
MIRSKYTDINYNGLNRKKLNLLTKNNTENPFHNSVVIIDEAHNFVSRIVNKMKEPNSISQILYENLMNAENARIVLLTGTPIINYPNEIGILFNILRGSIKTWEIKLEKSATTSEIIKLFEDKNMGLYDYIECKGNILTITRNPYGFVNVLKKPAKKAKVMKPANIGGTKKKHNKGTNKTKKIHLKLKQKSTETLLEPQSDDSEIDEDTEKAYRELYRNPYDGGNADTSKLYQGVELNESGNISDSKFKEIVISILKSANYLNKNDKPLIKTKLSKSLPDNSDDFLSMFVDIQSGNAKDMNLLKRRIMGLTSYFRSEQEELLPSFVKTNDGNNYHIVKSPMSNHQFDIYSKIRKEEAEKEKAAAKKKRQINGDELEKVASSYRIFSRAACNFVFPDGIERPVPDKVFKGTEGEDTEDVDETEFDAVPKSIRKSMEFSPEQGDDDEDEEQEELNIANDELSPQEMSYLQRINDALEKVNVLQPDSNKSKFLDESVLGEVSPKFKSILENLKDPNNNGLHLLYSHFRTIEGIGILRLILLANGFAEFKIQKTETSWQIVETDPLAAAKPKFVLYTGTETTEEKELIRNIYNGEWSMVPSSITMQLKETAENNNMGEIIKLFMITSSGAEGITLKNTRFVHITEPYWHMVRIEQVVGRARRICSHQDLPQDMRNVKVFLYITELSEEQKTDEKNIELRVRDISRIDKKTPVTTDETLYEKAILKQRINNEILRAIKESAVDCNLYKSTSKMKANADITDSEPRVCYGFGKVESNAFSSYPSLEEDKQIKEGLDDKEVEIKLRKIYQAGKEYGLDMKTNDVYDYASYELKLTNPYAQLIKVGTIIEINNKKQIKFD